MSDRGHREDSAPSVPYKYLDRPPLVHFKKEIMGNAGVTRCGIVYDVNDKHPTRTSAWYPEVTCDECSPYLPPTAAKYLHYPDTPGFVAGSETSQAAAESLEPDVIAGMHARIMELLDETAPDHLTCDELERITGWLHQSASARFRELDLAGRTYTTKGDTRPTRSGRQALVHRPCP